MRQQEQRLTRGARPGRLYLAGLGAASCQAILALILIAQWQGHKQLSAAPVGLAIISVPLTMALIGFVLYAAWSKQPGGAPPGLSRVVEAFERAFEQGTLRPLSPGGTLPLSSTYVARASHGITTPQK